VRDARNPALRWRFSTPEEVPRRLQKVFDCLLHLQMAGWIPRVNIARPHMLELAKAAAVGYEKSIF
jgi:hypothetical protein